MVKMLTVQVEDALAKDIDRAISLGSFSSRSEFMKSSIRKGIEEQIEKEKWRKDFDEWRKEVRKNALANGWNGKLPTRKERAKIADEYLAEMGLKYNYSKGQLEKIKK